MLDKFITTSDVKYSIEGDYVIISFLAILRNPSFASK